MPVPERLFDDTVPFDPFKHGLEGLRPLLSAQPVEAYATAELRGSELPVSRSPKSAYWRGLGRELVQNWVRARPAPPLTSPFGRSSARFGPVPKESIQKSLRPLGPLPREDMGSYSKER